MKRPIIILTLLSLCCTAACRQTLKIKTVPENASVWVNFVPLGKSPVVYRSRTGFPDSATVKASLVGYETIREFTIDKSYHADLSLLWLIPGIIPYFFTARYEDEVTIELKKSAIAPGAPESKVMDKDSQAKQKALEAKIIESRERKKTARTSRPVGPNRPR